MSKVPGRAISRLPKTLPPPPRHGNSCCCKTEPRHQPATFTSLCLSQHKFPHLPARRKNMQRRGT